MILYAFLAFINGIVVSTGRTLNGQLSVTQGAFKTSFWNHIVGFVFLALITAATAGIHFSYFSRAPLLAYSGGLFGAFFVMVSSYVFPRLGAMSAAVLVISGEMVAGLILDSVNSHTAPSLLQLLGGALVLFGVGCRSSQGSKRS